MSNTKTLVLRNNNIDTQHSTLVIENQLRQELEVREGHYKIIHIITEALECQWQVNVAAHASYEHWIINISADKVHYDLNVKLNDVNAQAKLRGIVIGQEKAQLQHAIRIDHLADETKTDIVMHGIADDQSRVGFVGLMYVKENIKGVVAHELLKNLLLSNKAEINAKPELEIYSNEIVCSHGASIGDLDEDALFYLQSRGATSAEAKAILLKSFAIKFLSELNNEVLYTSIEQLILEKIQREGHAKQR